MNEQAQEILVQLLQRAVSGVDAAIEFSQAQIPEVVEQLLLWHAVHSLIWFVAGLAVFAAVPFLLRRAERRRGMAMRDYEDGKRWTRYGGSGSVTSVAYDTATHLAWWPLGLLAPGAVLVGGNLEWLQILIAPKLYLLEYAVELTK